MSFHLYDLGPVAAYLQKYADNQGFVPQQGDMWQDFKWTRRKQKVFINSSTGKQNWQSFLDKANYAIIKAEEALLDLEFFANE